MSTPVSPVRLSMATLSSPDPQALARFYGALLGWEVGDDAADWATLRNPDGGVGLGFHIEDVYTAPVWPSEPGKQIMQGHLEIATNDLAAACALARSLGATEANYQPQEGIRVYLDPDGHPFCLFTEG